MAEEGKGNKGNEDEINLEDPRIKAAIKEQADARTETELAGLKANKEQILGEKRKLAEKLLEMDKKWEGLDPEKVRSLTQQFEQSEEAKLIADGKIEDVLNKRTEAMRQDANTRVGAATTRNTELEATIVAKDAKIAELVIDAQIGDAIASSKGCRQTARRDILRAAREVFALDENHAPIARTLEGTLRMGKNGKDPLTPAEWLDGEKEVSPHWWEASSGGGASGGTKLPDGSRLTEEQLSKMSASEKMIAAMQGKAGRHGGHN